MEENAKTHDLIFKYLSKKKLNELLLRADNGILEDEINKRLKKEKLDIPIVANAEVSTDAKTNNKCSLYIHFYNNGKPFGHISFHFSPKMSKVPGKSPPINGRVHPKNNRNTQRKYTFRFNANDANDSIRISLSKYCPKMNPQLEKCTNISVGVINDYLDKESNYFLGNPLFPEETIHPCLEYIVDKMRHTKTPIAATRKKSYQTKRPL
jgi:hypothetical protein